VCDCFPLAGYQYVVLRLRPFSSTAARQERLSERERTVAQLAARGEPLKVIADNCAISLQAVSTYLTRAKRKLGVASRTELVRAMVQNDGGTSSKGAPVALVAHLRFDEEWFRVLRRPATAGAAMSLLLTHAEAEVLAGLLRGLPDAEIARDRGTTVRTVAAQVAAIVRKEHVGSRTELVATVLSCLIVR
jgi:DNA-binding NarL/FixJ family response regulator